ncbi:MAG: hypothetical protein HYR85_26050, partial [Planctomycetes bacterium]|nr:hypothetical protein [Planctomycetota bacterium]
MDRFRNLALAILLLSPVAANRATAQITTRESVGADGSQLSADSGWTDNYLTRRGVSISADGRFVAYATIAAIDARDQNGLTDVYVRDRLNGAVTWASGPSGGGAWRPALSGDGRWVAFLFGDETGGDVFVRDVQTERFVFLGGYPAWDLAISG